MQRVRQFWQTHPIIQKTLPLWVLLFGGLVFALLMLTRPANVKPQKQARVWRVEARTIVLQTRAPTLTLYGKVETPTLVKAAAPKKSRVAQVLVREGERIEPGQLLLALDAGDFEPRVIQAKAKVDELKALIQSETIQYKADQHSIQYEQSVLALLQAALKRAQRLHKKNLGSKATLDQAREAVNRQQLTLINRKRAVADHQARLEQLKARLQAAVADVQLAELDYQRSRIVSPFAGIVESVAVTVGDPVKDSQILVSFYPLDKLEVRARIPAPYQAEIEQALAAQQVLPAQAQISGGQVALTLDRLAGKADARGIDGLFVIKTDQTIRLGEAAVVKLQRPARKQVAVLPASALHDNQRIYRVDEKTGRLQAVSVQVLGYDQHRILVYSPQLQSGDKVMITPLPNAVAGLKVTITEQHDPA